MSSHSSSRRKRNKKKKKTSISHAKHASEESVTAEESSASTPPTVEATLPDKTARIQSRLEELMQTPLRLPFTQTEWKGMMDLREAWRQEGYQTEVRRVETFHWPTETTRWYVGCMFLSLSLAQVSIWGGFVVAVLTICAAFLDVLGKLPPLFRHRFAMKPTQVTWGWKDSQESKAPIVIVSGGYDTPALDAFTHRRDRLSGWTLGALLNPIRLWLLWMLVGLSVLGWYTLTRTSLSFWTMLGLNLVFGFSFLRWRNAPLTKEDEGQLAAGFVAMREVASEAAGQEWPFHLHFAALGGSHFPEGVTTSLREWREKGRVLGWIHLDELHPDRPLQVLTSEGTFSQRPQLPSMLECARENAGEFGEVEFVGRYGRTPAGVARGANVDSVAVTSALPSTPSEVGMENVTTQIERAAGLVLAMLQSLSKSSPS